MEKIGVDKEIEGLYKKIGECKEQIEELEYKNPRCPHCRVRYGILDYSFTFVKDTITVECPRGHRFNIYIDEGLNLKKVGEKINALDFGYMD